MEYTRDSLLVEYHPNIVRKSYKKLLDEIMPLIEKQYKYTKAGKLFSEKIQVNFW